MEYRSVSPNTAYDAPTEAKTAWPFVGDAVDGIRTGDGASRPYIKCSVSARLHHLARVFVLALVSCRGPSAAETPIRADDPDGLYAPEVVRAIDLLSHDEARCARGWISRAIDTLQGRPVSPLPQATTLRQAAQQAQRERCHQPAPDIANSCRAASTPLNPPRRRAPATVSSCGRTSRSCRRRRASEAASPPSTPRSSRGASPTRR